MTQKEKERAFRVLLYALVEEQRVCGMDYETFKQRYIEALQQAGLVGETDDAK